VTAYCTQADLTLEVRDSELLQLCADDPSVVDLADPAAQAVLDRAIQRASNRIDAVAGAHYTVPFSPIPGFVRDLAVDLTLVSLAGRRNTTPQWAEDRRQRADDALRLVAAGTMTVGSQPEPVANPGRAARQSGEDRMLTPDALEGF
jgi:phage gp36-like protein